VDPVEATRIFIRSALVEEDLYPEPAEGRRERDHAKLSASQLLAEAREELSPSRHHYPFLKHNRQVRHKIETWQTRMRRHDLPDLHEALFEFYCGRIQNVSSLDELNRWLGEHTDPARLCATEADLVGDQQLSFDSAAFPDRVRLGGQSVPLSYVYSPGEERDGITMKLDAHLAHEISSSAAEWAVPGLREALITELLRALPKSIRRELMPFPPKVAEIARELQPGPISLKHDLANFIRARYGVDVPVSAWPADAVPEYLRTRFELIGHDKKPVGSGRDLDQLRRQLETVKIQPAANELPAWTELTQKWERFGLTGWTFGDVPERVTAGVGIEKVEAWPGLAAEDGQIHLRLFRTPDAPRRASLEGIRRLLEFALQKDLAWLQKDLRALAGLQPLLCGLCTVDELQAGAFANFKTHLLPSEPFSVLSQKRFQDALSQARHRLTGLASKGTELLQAVLKVRAQILQRYPLSPGRDELSAPISTSTLKIGAGQPSQKITSLDKLSSGPAGGNTPGWLTAELSLLVPKDFLQLIPFRRLSELPRYLKALQTRCERAGNNPAKDLQRSSLVAPYVAALNQYMRQKATSETFSHHLEEFRWMIEEFKVSTFAQELGTAVPVSPKRLDEQLKKLREAAESL
jgi:ATP-dependent helicase HrpA